MEAKPKIKIIITDDHLLFREAVKNALSKKDDIEFIGEAVHGVDLLDKLENLRHDIIILNVSMPVMDGIQTLPILKERYPGIKVIILTMQNNPDLIRRMVEYGANAYLTKDVGAEKIYEAILGCHKDGFFTSDTVRKVMIARKPKVSN